MRKTVVLLLSLVLTLGALAPAAFAGRCSDFGGCGGAGGGGYTQRDSGIWVPAYTQRSAPVATPAARSFGQELARDAAKDGVKYVGYSAIGAALHNAGRAIYSAWGSMPAEQRRAIPMMPVR